MRAVHSSSENVITVEERVDALDWKAAEESLSARGYAVTEPLLTAKECAGLVALYEDESRFRSHIIMERYRFGLGDYKYFDNPLPQAVLSSVLRHIHIWRESRIIGPRRLARPVLNILLITPLF